MHAVARGDGERREGRKRIEEDENKDRGDKRER